MAGRAVERVADQVAGVMVGGPVEKMADQAAGIVAGREAANQRVGIMAIRAVVKAANLGGRHRRPGDRKGGRPDETRRQASWQVGR